LLHVSKLRLNGKALGLEGIALSRLLRRWLLLSLVDIAVVWWWSRS